MCYALLIHFLHIHLWGIFYSITYLANFCTLTLLEKKKKMKRTNGCDVCWINHSDNKTKGNMKLLLVCFP